MKIKSNKKPHNDGTSWEADSLLQGSKITMDSNANHRARITNGGLMGKYFPFLGDFCKKIDFCLLKNCYK